MSKSEPKIVGRNPRETLLFLLGQREVSLVAVLLALLVFFSLAALRFASGGTVAQVVQDLSIVVIVGVGETLILFTRNIDVSIGSMVGISAFFGATFAAAHPELPLMVVVLVTCLLGLCLGAINGVLVAVLSVPSIMVTLGTLYIFRGMLSYAAGSRQVTSQLLPQGYDGIASWSLFGIPGLFIYAAVIAIFAHIFVRYTYLGRSMLALGSNPVAAAKLGISSKWLIFAAFAVSGALCGFAGVLWGARYGTVDSSVASGFEIVVLAAVVVGGVSTRGGSGSIGGVVIGAAILSTIGIGLALMNVSQFWLQALTGLVILSAITFDIVLRHRILGQGGEQSANRS